MKGSTCENLIDALEYIISCEDNIMQINDELDVKQDQFKKLKDACEELIRVNPRDNLLITAKETSKQLEEDIKSLKEEKRDLFKTREQSDIRYGKYCSLLTDEERLEAMDIIAERMETAKEMIKKKTEDMKKGPVDDSLSKEMRRLQHILGIYRLTIKHLEGIEIVSKGSSL